jgi:hypothetical protein
MSSTLLTRSNPNRFRDSFRKHSTLLVVFLPCATVGMQAAFSKSAEPTAPARIAKVNVDDLGVPRSSMAVSAIRPLSFSRMQRPSAAWLACNRAGARNSAPGTRRRRGRFDEDFWR